MTPPFATITDGRGSDRRDGAGEPERDPLPGLEARRARRSRAGSREHGDAVELQTTGHLVGEARALVLVVVARERNDVRLHERVRSERTKPLQLAGRLLDVRPADDEDAVGGLRQVGRRIGGRSGEDAGERGRAAHDDAGAVVEPGDVPVRDQLEVVQRLGVRREDGRLTVPRELDERLGDRSAAVTAQIGEGHLATPRRREQPVRALLGPVEEPGAPVRERAVARELGVGDGCLRPVALEKMHAADGDTPRRRQSRNEEVHRPGVRRDDLPDGQVLLEHVAAQRAVPAQYETRVGNPCATPCATHPRRWRGHDPARARGCS